ncbi:DMT family transporter [Hyalangium versicolor]|uniref:DMT family transporter n=1 Tax=Hyalangium versicolor TaxID=2861190 RepID=UPI001CCA1B8F|nr:EamA family transporter [Hyalangium versicolor]
MNARQTAALLFLSSVWGASYLFIRIAAPVLGPFPLMAGRVLIAAGALASVAAVRGMPLSLARYWKRLLILGLVHAAMPFTLIAMAEVHLSASMAAILVAAQPLFAALIGGLFLGERISPKRALGLVLGLGGVGVLVGWSPGSIEGSALAVGATLAGALSYAAGGIYSKRRLDDAPVMTLALGQQLSAAVWLLVPALLTLPRMEVSLAAVGAMCALALLSTALAYLVFFWLIGQVGPVRTFTVSYVIPVFGVLWGALFLDERPTLGVLAGLGCILISLVLVNDVRLESLPGVRRAPRLVRGDGQTEPGTT